MKSMRPVVMGCFAAVVVFAAGVSAWVVYDARDDMQLGVQRGVRMAQAGIEAGRAALAADINGRVARSNERFVLVMDGVRADVQGGIDNARDNVMAWRARVDEIPEQAETLLAQLDWKDWFNKNGVESVTEAAPPVYTLTEMMERKDADLIAAESVAMIEPAAGRVEAAESPWTAEQDSISVEAVLVPRQVTVISSSQDGRIADIKVGNGDAFKKGDLLIAYDCADLRAEADIVKIQRDLTRKKVEGSDRLFKLDILSDIDRLGIEVEDKQAEAKRRLVEARMAACEIRAEFDGHVTGRLANPGEYTRTDRVLLEVASSEPLQAEFLIPSKWLRWVNVGAPLSLRLGETEKTYTARVTRIYGEVDPVSQSIQMVAALDGYEDALLPGMSGQANFSVKEMQEAGVRGFLQKGAVKTDAGAH